ncbi:MAG: hypothetical protein JNL81_12640 [Hyphomonadaceae bacterium]|nr:hypothetical protein [Hyphomonadaceae bacterium]
MRKWLALAALIVLSACVTSQRTFTGQFEPPPANSRIVVMTPDVQLSILNATGMQEPREDWSRSAREGVASAVAAHVVAEGHQQSSLDPATAMEGRTGQVIRLHEVVGASILMVNYFGMNLPTRKDNFEWTLGEGAQEIRTTYNADYALFITGRGSYASAGRVAAMVGMAILGVGIPLGGQQAYASLVDLRTGNVIWFNVVTAAPNEDMREAEGSSQLVRRLMEGAPL